MIVVTSVPHSGHHFVVHELLKDIPDCDDDGPGKYSSHTYPDAMGELVRLLRQDHTCIVPVRHPIEVARSWKRRGKDPLDAIPFWERLIYQIDSFPVFYLPMDREDRDDWLQAINMHTDLELVTDWPMIGQVGYEIGAPTPPLTREEVNAVVELLFSHPHFFEQFDYLF